MESKPRFKWGHVIAAVIAAEALAIFVLIVVVMVYGTVRPNGSLTPEAFAPMAGNWIGPIGGFLATLCFARWAAKGSGHQAIAHGMAVGVGTALLDILLATMLGGGLPLTPVIFVSNGGRILAGFLGGRLALPKSDTSS
jgi:hypothetical protein